jgi:hypothetical protein
MQKPSIFVALSQRETFASNHNLKNITDGHPARIGEHKFTEPYERFYTWRLLISIKTEKEGERLRST